MNDDNEQDDQSSTNVDPTDIFEQNLSIADKGDDVEDYNFEMNDDNEQGDQSSTNVDPTDIIEQNLSTENDMIIDKKTFEICVVNN